MKHIKTEKVQNFISIISLVRYFKDKGIKANRNKIASSLNTKEIYLDHLYYIP